MQIPDRRTTPRLKVIEVTESMRKRRYRHHPESHSVLRAKIAEFILERQCRDAEKARSSTTDE